jgi:N-acetylglucosaminyldiphosphoundecaprenol N-acetyl-beta-D-mannosaminyltransferase
LPFDRVSVLGLPVDVMEERDLLDFLQGRTASRTTTRVATINAEFVVRARRDPAFDAVLRTADLATPDGWGVVWVMRRKGGYVHRRVGASDFIWPLAGQTADAGHRMFLLGGKEGVAEAAAARLREVYPRLQIAGTHAGSPAPAEEGQLVDLIRGARTDILLVAYGAPQQEHWIARNLERTGAVVGIGVGGTFDYIAGTAQRAPEWMRERGLEWSWRLLRQPHRWRRMLALPEFAWLVLWTEIRPRIKERTQR